MIGQNADDLFGRLIAGVWVKPAKITCSSVFACCAIGIGYGFIGMPMDIYPPGRNGIYIFLSITGKLKGAFAFSICIGGAAFFSCVKRMPDMVTACTHGFNNV
jgi:hypothetical protein